LWNAGCTDGFAVLCGRRDELINLTRVNFLR
jgi:hypothetical protein